MERNFIHKDLRNLVVNEDSYFETQNKNFTFGINNVDDSGNRNTLFNSNIK